MSLSIAHKVKKEKTRIKENHHSANAGKFTPWIFTNVLSLHLSKTKNYRYLWEI